MRSKFDESAPGAPGKVAGEKDIRFDARWKPNAQTLDTFFRTNQVEQKVKGYAGAEPASRALQAWETVAPLPHGIGNSVCGAFGASLVVAGGITWKDETKIWLR